MNGGLKRRIPEDANPESPFKLRKTIDKLTKENAQLKKKLQATRMKNIRLKRKVKSLEGVVEELKRRNLVSDECASILENTYAGVPKEIMKRIVLQKKKKNPGAYPSELRSFALTLKYYSSKAYRFVRKSFNLGLPSPSVIRSWYSKIEGDPGFTKATFSALAAKVCASRRSGGNVICSLMLDEMSIKKHVEWNGKEFNGFVDIGTGVKDDSLPAASNALVFMVVSVNSNWKAPCGYFFIDGMKGKEKASLVTTCLEKLHDAGVEVISLTCDGPSPHYAMLKELGANLSLQQLIPYFQHPSDPSKYIYVFLDVCHMLKLVRNNWAILGVIYDGDGKEIKWEYLVKLHELQESEGVHMANKLRSAHINWHQQKMKVNLAAQSLSSSVADALDYCSDQLEMDAFSHCQATTKFIRTFDHLFDVLNSRNPLSKNFKAPLRPSNYSHIEKFLDQSYNYISRLKNDEGILIAESGKKTGFLGFLIAIKSIKGLYEKLVISPKPLLKYILTYKFSQDHLELFFAAVRSAGGSNNNPTTSQFTSAYKKLLMRHMIEGGDGNCKAQDDTKILNNIEDQYNVNSVQTSLIDMQNIRRYDLEPREVPQASDHDYCDIPNIVMVTEYKEAVISYIAGFVAKKAVNKIACPSCVDALTTNNLTAFVTWKSNGGLTIPSQSLIRVCTETEKCIMRMINATGGRLPVCSNLHGAIATVVLAQCIDANVFKSLESHMYDTTATNNHIARIIKTCAQIYTNIRMKHQGKRFTDNITGKKVRKQLSKLILFKNQ